MLQIYGIPNCDTVQKAIKWLKSNEIDFEFHDYKIEGITKKKLDSWLKNVPIEKLLNKASTPYKELPVDVKPIEYDQIIKLMITKPTSIKRPVVEWGTFVLVGFKEEEYQKALLNVK